MLSALCIVAVSRFVAAQALPTVPSGFMAEIFTQVPGKPLGLTFAPDGKLIVCAWDDGKVYSVDPNGTQAVLNPEEALPLAAQPVVTSDGRVLVTAGGTNSSAKIWEIVGGHPQLVYEGQGAYGIELDTAGSVYFGQAPTGSILKTQLTDEPSVFASGLGFGLAELAFGPDGSLYAANDDNGTIYRIDSSGVATPYLTGLTRPEMLAFDNEGNLYFTAFTYNKVYKVDPDKNVTLFLRGPANSEIRGIAFDEAGSLFVCDTSLGVVYKVSAESGPFKAEISQSSPRCATIVVSNRQALRGGELGLAYDPSVMTAVAVKAGKDLPSGSKLVTQLQPRNNCAAELGVDAALSVAWITPTTEEILVPAGKHELLKVCFTIAEGASVGDCSPLRFVACLGVPEAPVQNVVTDESGASEGLETTDGQVCMLEETSFRRGDVNQDTRFDISDPIGILGCLFLGSLCPTCADAQDANDDGVVNIADPVHLLNWRFGSGDNPPPPFSECGIDPTADELEECESFAPCP